MVAHSLAPILGSLNIPPRITEADTIGGYITELAERIPTTGGKIADADLKSTVIEASTTSVIRVKITRSIAETASS